MMTAAQHQWLQILLKLSAAAVYSPPAVQALYNERIEEALAEIEPPQCECGGGSVERAGYCAECLEWEDYGYCEVCKQLAVIDGECEECGYGGACETCGYDKARGTYEVQIAVDRFVCKDEFGHKISRG